MRVGSSVLARCLIALAMVALTVRGASAQQVFTGDPTDPGTGSAYPIMPGLPLLLPGPDEVFGTGDDVFNSLVTGDVDLVVRSGSIAGSSIPPPSLAAGGAPIATVTAGGGSTGAGNEAAFTVMVSDGSGSPPYGSVIPNSDMDLRPVTVYAFADLDDDGILGPTDADGSGDNALELQEVTAYAGRQMGGLGAGRFTDSLGLEMGAPASIGGLTVALVAGAYTGNDPEGLFTDGPMILTHWPFFPPLDPQDLLGGGTNPAPDPDQANEIEWSLEDIYLPAPSHPTRGGLFAVAVDGSEPTNDQLLVESASAVSVRVFAEPSAADFVASGRPRLRVAPAAGASGRTLVLPVDRAVLAADGAASQFTLRMLPVDLFANVADPAAPIAVSLTVSGPAVIVSPDTDANDKTEPLSIVDAEGVEIVLDDDDGNGTGLATLTLAIGGVPVGSVALPVGAASDSDGDGVADDGSGSSLSGDAACNDAAAACDDNCARVINPSQVDSNDDGLGDCCDGTCIDDPLSPSCDECALPASPSSTALTEASMRVRLGGGVKDDKLKVKLAFTLAADASIAPDAESVSLLVTQAGSGGYSAALASLFTDLLKSSPSFRYSDRDGIVDGVVKAQIKQRGDGTWRMMLRAKGLSIADLAGGGAAMTLALGDDLFDGTLDCNGTAPRVDCDFVP